MADFFRKEVLRLVIRQETLSESLELLSELIDVVDFIAGEVLGCGVVFDQDILIHRDRLSYRVDSQFGIGMFQDPDSVGGFGGGD